MFTKKDIKNLYQLTDWQFRKWMCDYCEDFGINKKKQTFTPKQLRLMFDELGMPPNCNDKQRQLIALIMNTAN